VCTDPTQLHNTGADPCPLDSQLSAECHSLVYNLEQARGFTNLEHALEMRDKVKTQFVVQVGSNQIGAR